MNLQIDSEEEAKTVIGRAFGCFFVIGIFTAIRAAVDDPLIWADVVVIMILAILLKTLSSRVAAIFLLAYALLNFGWYLLGLFEVVEEFKANVFVLALFVYSGLRSVQATFLLQGRFAIEKKEPEESEEIARRRAPLGAISLAAGASTLVLWLAWLVLGAELAEAGGNIPQDQQMFLGGCAIVTLLLNVVAALIGFIGLFYLRQKAVTLGGLMLNLLIVLGIAVMCVMGWQQPNA